MKVTWAFGGLMLALVSGPALGKTTNWNKPLLQSPAAAATPNPEQVSEDPYGRTPDEVRAMAQQIQDEYLATASN